MEFLSPEMIIFGAPLALILTSYYFWQWRTSTSARNRLQHAIAAGLHEPPSLHPIIDPAKCMGCGACVSACPEGDILGLINRKAELVSPTDCIGHGACRAACPTGAISLVFGSETRGVDIPLLSPDFESSVPGVYIAGELGGMGLIKNAITQGRQAIEAIARRLPAKHGLPLDVVIVGAGPAGLSASLEAKARGLRFLVVEQDTIGGTLAHYPRGKMVMTQPADLPLVGQFQFREASKEELVNFWNDIIAKTGLKIRTGVRVESVTRKGKGLLIKTTSGDCTAATVLLALGRRGTPRRLEVPGEDLPKVVYRLLDAEQYIGQRVIVVGGGDSAIEAATAVARQPGAEVTLIHRGKAFSRAKASNREKLEATVQKGRLQVHMQSHLKEIRDDTVTISSPNGDQILDNDYVIICAGGILPTPFLRESGIEVEAKYGTA